MSKVYNVIGSLTAIKSRLKNKQIDDFKSLKEVIDFQNSIGDIKNKITSEHKEKIETEIDLLKSELTQLANEINIKKAYTENLFTNEIKILKNELYSLENQVSSNFFRTLFYTFKKWKLKRSIRFKENNFISQVESSISKYIQTQNIKNKRYQYLTTNFQQAILESAQETLKEIDRKKNVIDSLSSLIYGALGEQKVVKVLESLSDEFHLINDFSISFYPSIYYKQENDYIKSIQVDHILVGPSGVFLIETKNWSSNSLKNTNLRSPVEQIKRSSYVLYKLLNNEIGKLYLYLDKHHWGDKRVNIRNLIVMTNLKPKEEFQYVKVLTLDELINYINFFKPIYSTKETQKITDYLLRINEIKNINTK
jgi:hypothetical protein